MLMSKAQSLRTMAQAAVVMAWALATPTAMAVQAPVREPSSAQKLACLVTPKEAFHWQEAYAKPGRDAPSYMRLKLTFTAPDASPQVTVLANWANEAAQRDVHSYVAQYRLPCLTAADGPVHAVQEFSFSPYKNEPVPAIPPEQRTGKYCVVMPKGDFQVWGDDMNRDRGTGNLIAKIEFNGAADAPPLVSFNYSDVNSKLRFAVQEYVKQYRLTCRKAGDPPEIFGQVFNFRFEDDEAVRLAVGTFDLAKYLAVTRSKDDREVYFDLRTMKCPFAVTIEHLAPFMPNAIEQVGELEENRLPFTDWLRKRQLQLTGNQARDIFGSRITVNVPCAELRY